MGYAPDIADEEEELCKPLKDAERKGSAEEFVAGASRNHCANPCKARDAVEDETDLCGAAL